MLTKEHAYHGEGLETLRRHGLLPAAGYPRPPARHMASLSTAAKSWSGRWSQPEHRDPGPAPIIMQSLEEPREPVAANLSRTDSGLFSRTDSGLWLGHSMGLSASSVGRGGLAGDAGTAERRPGEEALELRWWRPAPAPPRAVQGQGQSPLAGEAGRERGARQHEAVLRRGGMRRPLEVRGRPPVDALRSGRVPRQPRQRQDGQRHSGLPLGRRGSLACDGGDATPRMGGGFKVSQRASSQTEWRRGPHEGSRKAPPGRRASEGPGRPRAPACGAVRTSRGLASPSPRSPSLGAED